MELLTLFRMGGLFMWPLLFFSVSAVAIILERSVYLARHNLRMDDLREKTAEYIRRDDISGASAYLAALSKRRLGARILLALLEHGSFSERRMEKAAEAEALGCTGSLERGLAFLAALGSLAPLTGFLGTVSGMLVSFKSIAEAADVNARIVAGGIYEALITTVFGLIIAIVAMTAHSLFSHAADTFAAGAEKTCTGIISEMLLFQKRRAGEEGRG